jgi:immune inhibitor A
MKHPISLLILLALVLAGCTFTRETNPTPAPPTVVSTSRPSNTEAPATPAENPTEAPTEEPTEAPTEAVTEVPTEEPTPAPETTATREVSQEDIQATLRVLEQTELPDRDLYALAIRFGKIPADTPRIASETDPGYVVGDELTFTVSNIATQENFQADATLRAQTDHANWWVHNEVDVDQEDLDASAQVFEAQTYPTNRSIFGSEWSPGIDGDVRVNIFLGDVAGVGGYFSSADEYPRSVNPNSNEKEIFYLNIYNAGPGNSYFDGILAHEFQHMIHWNTDRNEELWINEGLSELAAYLNDFDVGSSVQSYLSDPDITVTRWEVQTGEFYGSAYSFTRYLYNRFGGKTIAELVREPENGGRGVAEVTDMPFNDLFADWTVANLIDDGDLAEGQYESPLSGSPNFSATVRNYPFITEETVNQYGTDYYRFTAAPGDGPLTLTFEGSPTVDLLPTDAHSGSWMLWGNRGDDSYSSTYRAFDLSGVESATLNYWTWYAIEPDYDYGYVAISTDGGALWDLLETPDTTTENPNGNSLGNAYTAQSGVSKAQTGRTPSEWIEQTIDLTPYVGQEVLIGFHYVTDDALNYNGMLIDDVAIPEIDYEEDFEDGSEGWEFGGWARVDNVLPQTFILRVVTEGNNSTEVLPLEVDPQNRAALVLDTFGTEIERVTLIVTAATQETTREAEYTIRADSR